MVRRAPHCHGGGNFTGYEKMKEIIAERKLILEDEIAKTRHSVGRTVLVQLGKPEKSTQPPFDFRCAVRILGIGDEKVRYAQGVDAFQALQLGLELIAIELSLKLNPRYHNRLRWEG